MDQHSQDSLPEEPQNEPVASEPGSEITGADNPALSFSDQTRLPEEAAPEEGVGSEAPAQPEAAPSYESAANEDVAPEAVMPEAATPEVVSPEAAMPEAAPAEAATYETTNGFDAPAAVVDPFQEETNRLSEYAAESTHPGAEPSLPGAELSAPIGDPYGTADSSMLGAPLGDPHMSSFSSDSLDLYSTPPVVEVEEIDIHEEITESVRDFILNTDVGPGYYDAIRREIYSSPEELECVSDIDAEEITDPLRAAVVLDLQGRRRDCITHLSKSDSVWTTQLHAVLLLEEGKNAEVLKLLIKARELHPNAPELETLWIETMAISDDLDGARAGLATLSLGTDSREHGYLEGLILEREGYYSKALESYESAIVEEDPPARYCFRLAYLQSLHGDEDRALEVYEMLKNAVPVYARAMINLGILYEDNERYEEAYQCYETILLAYPDHERAAMYLQDTEYSQDMYYDREKEKEKLRRKQLLQIPVTDFELSVRSRNCLCKMDIYTLGDLIHKTEAELLSYKNFGETSLTEIKKILSQKGFRLGQGLDDKKRSSVSSDPQKSSLLNEPVSVLELSSRAQRCMDRLGIESLHDLAKRTELELVGQRNFGVTSLQEVKRKLKERGLSLASG